MIGITAAQFNQPDITAIFKLAVETAINDDTVTATDISAVDVARRLRRLQVDTVTATWRRLRPARRLETTSVIDVSYTLLKKVNDNEKPFDVFEEVTDALTVAIMSDELSAWLDAELGVTLDQSAYTEPTYRPPHNQHAHISFIVVLLAVVLFVMVVLRWGMRKVASGG